MNWTVVFYASAVTFAATLAVVVVRFLRAAGVLPSPPGKLPRAVEDAVEACEAAGDIFDAPGAPEGPAVGSWVRVHGRGQDVRVLASEGGTVTVWLEGKRKPDKFAATDVQEVLTKRVLGS